MLKRLRHLFTILAAGATMQGGNIGWLKQRSRKYIASGFRIEIEVYTVDSDLHVQNYQDRGLQANYKLYQ